MAVCYKPVEALVGGVLIGMGAGTTFLFNGRIMGLSGIIRYHSRRSHLTYNMYVSR